MHVPSFIKSREPLTGAKELHAAPGQLVADPCARPPYDEIHGAEVNSFENCVCLTSTYSRVRYLPIAACCKPSEYEQYFVPSVQ